MPAALFNDRFEQLLDTIGDERTRALLAGGKAYENVNGILGRLSDTVRTQVVDVYSKSLQRVWQIGIVFAGVSFLVATFGMREVKMRQHLGSNDDGEATRGEGGNESAQIGEAR